MILCLDAGNSRLKWGLRDGIAWRATGVAGYGSLVTLASALPQAPNLAIACNVAGSAAGEEIEALARQLGIPLHWFRSASSAAGVRNGYARPDQLGADRWAALIGARALHTGDAVVVMAGTATTIDQLDAGGCFRGGLILPGLRLMRAALARDTANLPFAEGRYSGAPDNTDDAIVAGSLHATLGAIERMRSVLGPGTTALLSGGAAVELLPHIPLPSRSVENLVLEGLARSQQFAADV